MKEVRLNRRFGIAWVTFTLAVAVHVADEAMHDFLSTYNSTVCAHRWMPGVYSSPLLLLASIFLLASSRARDPSMESWLPTQRRSSP